MIGFAVGSLGNQPHSPSNGRVKPLAIRRFDTESGGQRVTGLAFEAIVMIAGIGLLAHQSWQLVRARRHEHAIERPRTRQQAVGVGTLIAGTAGLLLVAAGYGRLQWIGDDLARITRPIGLAVFLGGVVLRIWAMRSLGAAVAPDLRIGTRSPLVTNGAYSWVRHPYYLSAILLTAGAGLALSNAIVLGAAVLLTAVLLGRIRVEEHMLGRHYGAQHLEYRRQVPMLMPRVLRQRSERHGMTDGHLYGGDR